MSVPADQVAFAILADGPGKLGPVLKALFTHGWVASYQVGFGPPLLKSSDRIIARVREARSALEKLDAYLEICILDEDERRRLADAHRRLTVRRLGPVDAELVDDASADALDLGLRLHNPPLAPPAVQADMRAAGVPFDALPLRVPPEALSARLLVRLADPRNERLLHHDPVRAATPDPDRGLALELRVPAPARPIYTPWLNTLTGDLIRAVVALDELTPHARVKHDGESR